MDIASKIGRLFNGLCVIAAASALGGCVAETTEGSDATEDAVVGKEPAYVYVQVGSLTHRRVSLTGGRATVSVPTQGGTQNPVLFLGQQLADFGALTQPAKVADLDSNLALWKLAGKLGAAERWHKDLAAATADIKAIVSALDAASGKGCSASDWHVATFKDDAADFVCGTLADGTKTLGKAKPVAAGSGASACDLDATAAAKRSGDTVTLTFTRNGSDETISGQWYSADGTPWEGGSAADPYRCPDSKCSIVATKLTTSRPQVTFTATRLNGRKVQFISTGGACVYGPY